MVFRIVKSFHANDTENEEEKPKDIEKFDYDWHYLEESREKSFEFLYNINLLSCEVATIEDRFGTSYKSEKAKKFD